MNRKSKTSKTLASRGRPTKSGHHFTKQLILKTALRIVQDKGTNELSFRLLEDQLKVTPMAVAYHTGNKQQLLAELVSLAFESTLPNVGEEQPANRARSILSTYCERALMNANLLRAIPYHRRNQLPFPEQRPERRQNRKSSEGAAQPFADDCRSLDQHRGEYWEAGRPYHRLRT